MAIAVAGQLVAQLNVVRTFQGQGINGGDKTVSVNNFNGGSSLTGSTTPAITKDAELQLALSSGAVTLDLTAVADPDLGNVSFNGLTIQQMLLTNPASNANPISIGKGASNGYTGFGATFFVTLQPGSSLAINLAGSAVGGSSKTLDLTGTGAQALNIQLTGG